MLVFEQYQRDNDNEFKMKSQDNINNINNINFLERRIFMMRRMNLK